MTPAQIAKIMSLVDLYAGTPVPYAGDIRKLLEAALRDAPQWPSCRGVPRAGCNYLAACDTVCNKCGEVHRFPFATPSAPTAVEPDERAMFEAWAESKGHDMAVTYDTERSRWIYFGPMTADLWECWSAARASKGTK